MLYYLLALVAVISCSISVIFIKLSSENMYWLAAWRLLVAVALLAPIFFYQKKKHHDTFKMKQVWQAFLPGLFLALHFISWISGARKTPAANSTVIVNLIPIIMPFIIFALTREKPTGREILGTLIAMMGVVWIGVADFSISQENFWGDTICFGSMFLACFYIALAKKNQDIPNIFLYITPLYFFAAICCIIFALCLGQKPLGTYSTKELMLILGLGTIPTVIGHSLINYLMKKLRSQIVASMALLQIIFAGSFAYFWLDEIPHASFYFACIFFVTGVLIVLIPQKSKA